TFQIHHRIRPAIRFPPDAGERREVLRVFQNESVSRARIEPDVENVVDLLPAFIATLAKKALTGVWLVPGVGALILEGLDDAQLDFRVLQDIDGAVGFLLDEDGDRHAPGALTRDHPIRFGIDHAVDAVLALRRHPLRGLDRLERAIAQRVVAAVDVLVHRNEPLRRVAEDDRLLRAPRVRILVLEAAARDEHVRVDQRLDHRLVGVALLTLVVDDALAGETGRLRGERAVLIDGIGDRGIDAALFECTRIGGPDLEVLAAMTRRGVDEARTRVVGDVLAGE